MTYFLRGFLLPALLVGACLVSPARAQLSESELVTRLNRLENQVRQLTGQVEQLQYRNQQLEQQAGRPAGAPQTVPARPRPPPPPKTGRATSRRTSARPAAVRPRAIRSISASWRRKPQTCRRRA